MEDLLDPVTLALAGGTDQPMGWFQFFVQSATWVWSPTLYAIHGFEPGEIVPSTELFLAHKHPEDRAHSADVLNRTLATGEPFCCRHRIIDAQRRVRVVISIGVGVLSPAGQVELVHGYFVDITDVAARAAREDITAAVEHSAAHRAVIEQAKGALMLVNGVTAEDAFAILAWHSSHSNVKLREVAESITAGLTRPYGSTETPNQRIARLLGGVVAGKPADDGTCPES